jgi:EmrB/QacA subfamily drug resistance transporter
MTIPAPPGRLTPDLLRMVLPIVLVTLAVQLDATMTSVALKSLLGEFSTSLSTIQWVQTAYLLAFCVVIPLTGWAVDRSGAKRMWLISIGLFLAGSIACGASWSAGSLIVFRTAQGIGGGLLVPLSQSMIVRSAQPAQLGRLMGVLAIPSLLGPVFGPTLGGLLVDGFSWRWIFYVNVPICVAAFALSLRFVPSDGTKPGGAPLDVLGFALLCPGVAALAFGLSQAGDHGGFGAPQVVWPAVAGAALLAGFVAHASRTRIQPVIDLRFFRDRTFAASAATLLLTGLMMFGAGLLLPLYYQQVRGYSAAHAGLLLAPQGVGMAIALTAAGRLTDRVAARTIVLIGVALTAAGLAFLTGLDSGTNEIAISSTLVVTGLGVGAVMVPAMTSSYRGLSHAEIPHATTAIRTVMQLGSPFGIAVFAVVLQDALTAHPGTAYGRTFAWALGCAVLCVIPAAFLPGRRPTRS